MARHSSDGSVAWFIAGLTVGFAGALLLAPRSGEETRRNISDAMAKGRELASDKRKQAAEFGRGLYEQGREFVDDIHLPRPGAQAEAAEADDPAETSEES